MHEQLGELDRVERRPLAEVVAGHPQVEGVGLGLVLPEPPDEHGVDAGDGTLRAFHNVCLHRGARLVDGSGCADDGTLRCPFHAWRYALDGRCVEVVDADDFAALPADLRLPPVRAEAWGGFVFVNLDPAAEPLLDFLHPLPEVLGPYHLEQMRLRSFLTTVLPTNWKAAVDAFNENGVTRGEVVAEVPAGKLGVPVHASIAGRVARLDATSIWIERK